MAVNRLEAGIDVAMTSVVTLRILKEMRSVTDTGVKAVVRLRSPRPGALRKLERRAKTF
jgi:hypothetical protein